MVNKMLNLFKKKDNVFHVVACIDGKCIPISEVKDPVFAEKMIGDGFAIVPSGDTVVAPIGGEIVSLFPTGHAIGIAHKGIKVLIHIGIDTVNMEGEGFTPLIKKGDVVKAGQPIMKLDMDKLKASGYDLTTMTIFTSGYDKPVKLSCYNDDVKSGDILI